VDDDFGGCNVCRPIKFADGDAGLASAQDLWLAVFWESRWNRITFFWMEDPTPPDHSACGWGKIFNSIVDCYTLIQEQFDRLHSNHRGTRWPASPICEGLQIWPKCTKFEQDRTALPI
jgi:hypothetical protein